MPHAWRLPDRRSQNHPRLSLAGNDPAANERAVDVQVNRLRRKIDASEDGQAMIKTIRGAGYMFVPSVVRE